MTAEAPEAVMDTDDFQGRDLSVVIPSYDTAAMTLRCCQAVRASAPPGTEIIVADDGSRDGTADLLSREMPEVKLVRLESNRGFAAAANRGVEAASGRIILLLNSDALVHDGALRAFVAAFEEEAALGVGGASLLNEDGSPQWSGGRTPTLAWMVGVVSGAGPVAQWFRGRRSHEARRVVDWVSGAAMAFRREVWSQVGPLSERFLFYCQDIEFCLRARAQGWNVRLIDSARVTHGLGRTVAAAKAQTADPELLWPDLLRWGTTQYGRRWSLLARPVLIAAAALRIGWRKVRRPLKTDAVTSALVRAMWRLAQSDS